jgi:membrane protein involved in colicin uptake
VKGKGPESKQASQRARRKREKRKREQRRKEEKRQEEEKRRMQKARRAEKAREKKAKEKKAREQARKREEKEERAQKEKIRQRRRVFRSSSEDDDTVSEASEDGDTPVRGSQVSVSLEYSDEQTGGEASEASATSYVAETQSPSTARVLQMRSGSDREDEFDKFFAKR